jgi:nicotinate dehydrogenase subunit B
MSAHRRGAAVSRRAFLQTSALAGGGLVLWFSGGCTVAPEVASTTAPSAATPGAEQQARPGATPAAPSDSAASSGQAEVNATAGRSRGRTTDLDAWLRVGRDGGVILYTGKVEFGQGIQTAFGQLVAEELSLPFEQVSVVMGTTDQVPFDSPTVGSQSMRSTGPVVRQAAAEMRQWLLELGSQHLNAPAEQLRLDGGFVMYASQPDQRVSLADLAGGTQSQRQMSGNAVLKSPDQYTVIGQAIPRVDVPLKVNGAIKYGYDMVVPGMVHGKILRAPSLGATLQSVDVSQAQQMPGVVGVFEDGDFVGLAAERLDQANAALKAINANWNEPGSPHTS